MEVVGSEAVSVLVDSKHVLRSPFSPQKMRYQPKSQTVICRSKTYPALPAPATPPLQDPA